MVYRFYSKCKVCGNPHWRCMYNVVAIQVSWDFRTVSGGLEAMNHRWIVKTFFILQWPQHFPWILIILRKTIFVNKNHLIWILGKWKWFKIVFGCFSHQFLETCLTGSDECSNKYIKSNRNVLMKCVKMAHENSTTMLYHQKRKKTIFVILVILTNFFPLRFEIRESGIH